MQVVLKKNNTVPSSVSDDISSNSLFNDENLESALKLYLNGDFQLAFDIYEKVFKKELNTAKGRYALVKLSDCYFKLGRKGIDKYLAGISESYKNQKKDEISVLALELINRELLNNGEYEQVADNFKKIMDEYNINSEVYKSTLYGLFSLYVSCFHDTKTASSYYEELKQKYPGDRLIVDCEMLLGNKNNNSFREDMTKDDGLAIKEETVFVSTNYPNPFNPTTTISYTLPEDGKVQIKVFDVLGREVATLMNGFEGKGRHSIVWDGSNAASGIYFYSITYKGQTINKKMLLIK